MVKVLTFNELRKIKDSLPDGAIHQIAKELDIPIETVWNYFGGEHFKKGVPNGVHIEQGPEGGMIELDDTAILDMAMGMINPVT